MITKDHNLCINKNNSQPCKTDQRAIFLSKCFITYRNYFYKTASEFYFYAWLAALLIKLCGVSKNIGFNENQLWKTVDLQDLPISQPFKPSFRMDNKKRKRKKKSRQVFNCSDTILHKDTRNYRVHSQAEIKEVKEEGKGRRKNKNKKIGMHLIHHRSPMN